MVCNSLLQESWGREETLHQLPYKRGAPFETIILVHEDVFKVGEPELVEMKVSPRVEPKDNAPCSPAGGGKWSSPAGIQAQNSSEQGRHLLHLWESQGARYRLHPKLSEYISVSYFRFFPALV